VVGTSQAEDGPRGSAGLESLVLEEHATADVARAHGAEEEECFVGARELHGRAEKLRPELVALVVGRDEGSEEIGVLPPARDLDSAEAHHAAVLLVDEKRLLGWHVPVGEFALELGEGRPERVSHLLFGPVQRTPGELEDLGFVLASEATQAAGHEGLEGQDGRSPARRPR
jgi:hypothetical protein